MRASFFVGLSLAPWILPAQMSWDMGSVPVITAGQPIPEAIAEVQDRGRLFGRDAERRAKEALGRVHRRHRAPVLIETLESLDGAWVADVAGRRARLIGAERLYILVAGGERDVGVIAARLGPASRLTDRQREAIRRAFLEPLRAGEADEALDRGVRAIGSTLDVAASRPSPGGRDALIPIAVLLVALAVRFARRARSRDGGRGGRRRRTAAEVAAGVRVDGPPSAGPMAARGPRAAPSDGRPQLRNYIKCGYFNIKIKFFQRPGAANGRRLRWTSSGSGSASTPS